MCVFFFLVGGLYLQRLIDKCVTVARATAAAARKTRIILLHEMKYFGDVPNVHFNIPAKCVK